MSAAADKVLLIGYGNPGRLDDGLGPALARSIAQRGIKGVRIDSDYQLTVEDAAAAAEVETVIFADADTNGPEPFWLKRLEVGSVRPSFSTHSISPEGVLALARELFDAKTEAWLMGIRGYDFNEFGEGLSSRAQENLSAASGYLELALRTGQFEEVRAEGARRATRTENQKDEG